ncbi:MAG: ribosome small subunit-dependent GTPase A [Chloroflexota bacterium]
MSSQEKNWQDYLEYDEEYEDALYEDAEYLAKRNRKSRPKRASKNLLSGIVIRALGHHFEVQINSPENSDTTPTIRLCEVRRRLRQDQTKDTLVAVGDRVWVLPNGESQGKIEQIEERETVLSRQRPGTHILAEDVILANPDQVLVIFAAAQPEPHLRMLDRFLVIAEYNELPTVICINKVDLTGKVAAQAIFSTYEQIGYPLVYSSAETGEGIDQLRELLSGQITAITGPSGVGKSSLINALHPEFGLETGDLRTFLNKGKHTTRAAHLLALPFGQSTFVADTPGIRELGLYDIDPADLGFYFIDIEPYVNECRFPNCTHNHEPGCAVQVAVEQGRIAKERYESYLRLLKGEDG